MFSYEKSNISSYVKDKLKMLREFGIKVDGQIKDDLNLLNSTSDIDRRCRTIIENHIDKINDLETRINKSCKK